jgi:OOP family OmpA-OmpF porin
MEKNMRAATASTTLALAVLAALASPFAMADAPWVPSLTDDSYWYGGLNLGQSRAKIDDARISDDLLGGGFTTTSISDDDHHLGYKIFAGYKFNQNFAIESGYFDLGRFGFTAATLPAGALAGEVRVRGVNADAVGMLPFTEKLSGFARIGLDYIQARDSFAGTGLVRVSDSNPGKDQLSYKFGLGLQYDFTTRMGARLEMERYRVNPAVGNKGDIDLLSIGMVMRFGGSSPDSRSATAAPAPAAAPALVIVPVPAKSQQYCSILDIQFEIDQDQIQREEKEKLGAVGTFMTKYPATTAVIEGHSDNVGTAEDNLKLSQSRADSVVRYLEDTSHIAASRLSAVGYGETRPIADNDTQAGQRMNRRIDAIIACATDVAGLTVRPNRVTMAMYIDFDANQSDVKPVYSDDLRNVANFMKANPGVTATVEGHTGNLQATPALGMQMSEDRAQNVVDYLVTNFGIARSRLSAEGFGQTRRFAYNTSLEGQQENRRVNIIFNYPY